MIMESETDTRPVHDLKVLPELFNSIEDGTKPFEVRKNDRNFRVGDYLCLREWVDIAYTGRYVYVEVIFILQGGQFGIEPGYVVMGISRLED